MSDTNQNQPEQPAEGDKPIGDRRAFFRSLMLRGLDQAEKATDAVQKRFERLTGPIEPDASPSTHEPSIDPPERFLRPPGALPAEQFAETCSGCADCVVACPAQCIVIDADVADGLPFIVPRESPCVVCTDLSCMKVCPTGALELVEKTSDIDMGVAIFEYDTCLRNPSNSVDDGSEDCTLCIVHCPEEDAAIGLDDDGKIEVREGCIGCGVCERACPTEPASIWIKPVNDTDST